MIMAFFAACAAPVAPDFLDYDASCVTDADCAVVAQDRTCGFSCDTTRTCLSTAAAEAYQTDEADYVDWLCDGGIGLVGCVTFATFDCTCDAGTCAIVATPTTPTTTLP